jgi:biotin carboxyl carrier protein
MPPVQPVMDAPTTTFAGERLSVPEKVVIAPCLGQFRAVEPEVVTAEGEVLDAGQVVGYIDNQGQSVPVRSRFAGWMMGLLVHDGERVREGQPIAWLRAL